MSGVTEDIRRRMESTEELGALVHTMRALAASSIGQYEEAIRALGEYYRTVRLGLSICLRGWETARPPIVMTGGETAGAVVFGSDQGLVGQFNETLTEFVVHQLALLPGSIKLWVIGERLFNRLTEANLTVEKAYGAPHSVQAITPLVGRLLVDIQLDTCYIFHNRPKGGAVCEPHAQRLLPLDEKWIREITMDKWVTPKLPVVLGDAEQVLGALLREYLFVSLFKACAESLAAEHTSRLVAMQRAEKNIAGRLEELQQVYHHERQNAIDEELFDIFSGYEAMVSANFPIE